MTEGIHSKYSVERTDGSSALGGKHAGCSYFVLDLTHDPFAIPALKAYARACRKERPELAADLQEIINAERPPCGCREAMCPHTPRFAPDSASEMMAMMLSRREPHEAPK